MSPYRLAQARKGSTGIQASESWSRRENPKNKTTEQTVRVKSPCALATNAKRRNKRMKLG